MGPEGGAAHPSGMTSAPLPSIPPDGRRAGATWVAATGAFLLLASAALFVAVRWDQLPEGAKVALVGALTGGFLAGGRALRRTLPATGDVLFHLGALLIPIDVAALSLRLNLGWRPLLLAEGLVGAGVLGALAAAASSVVLTVAAALSVVVLAAGVAAVTPVPAPLLLVGAAAAAHLAGRRRAAIAWAGLAGLAPVIGALAMAALRVSDTATGRGVLVELGLGGRAAALVAVLTSAVAAAVLGREAARSRDLSLVALAALCLVSGAATTWVNTDPSGDATFLAVGALFVLVQAVATLCQRDPFWARPARALGLTCEVAAAVIATPVAAGLLLLAPVVEEGIDLFGDAEPWRPEPVAAVAWVLLATGWLLAAWRRLDPSGPAEPGPAPTSAGAALRAAVADDRTVVFLASALGAAAVVGTASTIAIGAVLVVLAAGLASVRGVMATLVAVAAAVWAPVLLGFTHPAVSLPVGLAGAAALGLAALVWRDAAEGWASTELALGGSILAFVSAAIARPEIGLTWAMLASVAAAWGLALVVERPCPMAGHATRVTMLLGLAGSLTGSPAEAVPVAIVVTLLFAFDAIRHDEPLISLGAAVAVQVAVAMIALAAGVDLATTGVVLCASALVYGVIGSQYPARWRLPFAAAAAAGLVAGLPLAWGDGARFAEALVLVGGVAIAAGVVLRNGVVGHTGGAVAAAGVALHLVVDGVTALEAFAAPVALQLLVAGWQLRQVPTEPSRSGRPARLDRASSWVAYGPAIGLLGGAALVERLSGGAGWHALVAGAVGVAAVAIGGWRRLAGPLFLGTALIGAITVLESLTALAGVPTWAWLAAGGTVLLTAGVALERTATSPIEAGRRLVDVVDERFS